MQHQVRVIVHSSEHLGIVSGYFKALSMQQRSDIHDAGTCICVVQGHVAAFVQQRIKFSELVQCSVPPTCEYTTVAAATIRYVWTWCILLQCCMLFGRTILGRFGRLM